MWVLAMLNIIHLFSMDNYMEVAAGIQTVCKGLWFCGCAFFFFAYFVLFLTILVYNIKSYKGNIGPFWGITTNQKIHTVQNATFSVLLVVPPVSHLALFPTDCPTARGRGGLSHCFQVRVKDTKTFLLGFMSLILTYKQLEGVSLRWGVGRRGADC